LSTYVDTSFLVSLYCIDANTSAAAHWMQGFKGTLLITTFGDLEFINAIGLRVFRKEISPHRRNPR
jgi:predicted nucleic acid-binding protein